MKYEYLVVTEFDNRVPDQEALNKLGQEGWELVAVMVAYMIFKREVEDE